MLLGKNWMSRRGISQEMEETKQIELLEKAQFQANSWRDL